MYEDKTLICKDCGNEFIFTAGEQEFYAEKGFQNEPLRCKDCILKARSEIISQNEPLRCKDCRIARKNSIRGERKMYTINCADCGAEAKVPFEPKNNKPVYCSECYAKHKDEEI